MGRRRSGTANILSGRQSRSDHGRNSLPSLAPMGVGVQEPSKKGAERLIAETLGSCSRSSGHSLALVAEEPVNKALQRRGVNLRPFQPWDLLQVGNPLRLISDYLNDHHVERVLGHVGPAHDEHLGSLGVLRWR